MDGPGPNLVVQPALMLIHMVTLLGKMSSRHLFHTPYLAMQCQLSASTIRQLALICNMTPDEAERKRASDRIHQRYSRARKKTQFDQLKAQNAVLTARLEETEKKLKQLQENHEALRALHRTPPQQAVAQCEHQLDAQVQPENLTPLYAPDSSSSPSFLSSCASANPVVRNDLLFDMSIDFGTGLMVDLFNDNSLGLTAPFNSLSDASELWPANNQPNPDSRAIWANSCGTAVHATLEIEHESNNRLAPIDTERLEIWESVPLHLPPVTSADYVLIGVSESGRKWSRKRGEPYRELSQQSFPSISSLLNPTTHDEASNPVSAAVGKHTTWDTSVISFPSRVAYHYIVAHMVRWLVCRTEDRFNQLPGFLKPTHLQRTVPHPAWVDMFPW